MTLTEKAMKYARGHLQAVRICWVDHKVVLCRAKEAVELCSDPSVSGCIVGVVAQDRKFQEILEQLIDGD